MSHERILVEVDGLVRHLTPSDVLLSVGRHSESDLRVSDLRVSRRHLLLEYRSGIGWSAVEVPGCTGVFQDGERVQQVVVDRALSLRLGDPECGPVLSLRPEGEPAEPPSPQPGEFRLGRGTDNDACQGDLLLARRHAILQRAGASWRLADTDSRLGVHINGRRTLEGAVRRGDLLAAGQTVLELTDAGPRPRPDDAPTVECERLVVEVGETRILDGIDFSARAGQFTAVVGPTGCGKSTLLRTLSGEVPAAGGAARIHGHDAYQAREALSAMVGYVPQDDILHAQLSLRAALTFAAELRFAADVETQEREARVAEVIGELGLDRVADIPVHRLSGGQRKRTSVAMELLTAPSVILLDEPTSGLDPGYEKTLMELFRRLADGRTVLVVTHSTQSLHLCDSLLFLATGGRQAYFGPPEGALERFGAEDYADAYQRLERGDVALPAPAPRTSPRETPRATQTAQQLPRDVWLRQFGTLARRQIAVLLADRRMALYLLGAAAVPALLVNTLTARGAWTVGTVAAQRGSRTLVAAIVVAATTIGVANTVREVVKERAILRRDRAGGMSVSAYMAAKGAVFGGLTLAQTLVLLVLGTARADGPSRGAFLPSLGLELFVALGVTAVAAAALGLLLSSLVSSSEKAMALIPMVFVVQWLFSGAAIDVADKPVMGQAAYAASANWGVAAVAASVEVYELEARCGHEAPSSPGEAPAATGPAPVCDARWQGGAWRWLGSVVAGSLLAAALFLLAVRVCERKHA